VQRVLVQSGDRVTPTIAILDDADQQLAVAEAQARLAQERSELARLEVGTRRENCPTSGRITFSPSEGTRGTRQP